mmetsp:Transcript_10893/g.23063  ORF Transcript_10893/g.23063 Transcript_10893/m.23063 type:complete len:84 (+) Transcript_10893:680-931(+)
MNWTNQHHHFCGGGFEEGRCFADRVHETTFITIMEDCKDGWEHSDRLEVYYLGGKENGRYNTPAGVVYGIFLLKPGKNDTSKK